MVPLRRRPSRLKLGIAAPHSVSLYWTGPANNGGMIMPRLRVLNQNEVPQDVGEAFDRFMKVRGNIPNMFRTIARRPTIMGEYYSTRTGGRTRNVKRDFYVRSIS